MSDIASTGGRLSYLNITDRLLRVELFREIRKAQEDSAARGENWGSYVIQPGDRLSPELVAYKLYGIDTLKWVIMVAAYMDDPRDPLEVGRTIYLPTTSYLRERIKYYESLGART